MNYGDQKQAEIFKKLAFKSGYQVGLEYGFDKQYTSNKAVRSAVSNIRTRVKNNPERFAPYGITTEIIQLVDDASQSRSVIKNSQVEQSVVEQSIDKDDIKSLVTSIRDKTFGLIDKKIDMVSKSRKKLDALSFKDLGIIAGIAFDKTQILKGQATENIAVMAKIDKNMSPDDALAMVSKLREKNSQDNDLRNK